MTVFGDIVITKLMEDTQIDWTIRDLKIERVSQKWKLVELNLSNNSNIRCSPSHPTTSQCSFNLLICMYSTGWFFCAFCFHSWLFFVVVVVLLLFSFFLKIFSSFCHKELRYMADMLWRTNQGYWTSLIWWEVKFLFGHLSCLF